AAAKHKPRPFRRPGPRVLLRSGGSGGRASHATPLRSHFGRGAIDVLRELRATVEDVALDLGHPERAPEVVPREVGVERLAGEDVHRHVALVGERVDADVALGDQNETRQAPVLGLQAAVLEHVGRHDLRHADACGEFFQDPVDEVQVRQLVLVTPVPIEHEVRPEAGHLVSHLLKARATRGVAVGMRSPWSCHLSDSPPPYSSKSSSFICRSSSSTKSSSKSSSSSLNSSSSRSSSSNSSSSSSSSSPIASTSSPPKTSKSSSSPPFFRFMTTPREPVRPDT